MAALFLSTSLNLSRHPDPEAFGLWPIALVIMGAFLGLPALWFWWALRSLTRDKMRELRKHSQVGAFLLGFGLCFAVSLPEAFGFRVSAGWCAAYVLLFIPAIFAWAFTQNVIPRGPVCSTCSYYLRAYRPGDKCPECGTPVPEASSPTNC